MKKTISLILLVVVALAAGTLPASAHAHIRGGLWIGPVWGPWWGPAYPYPYPYYESPPVVIQQQPPVYEEQAPQQEEQQQYYWYYCPDSKTYYPYVRQCPGGWLKVVPTPPKSQGKEE